MKHRYWDSDCFLGWLLAEADKESRCKQVLEEARANNVILVTSALTIAEVLALRGHPKIPNDRRLMVERFFRNDYIYVRSVTRKISEKARELVWDRGIAPKDAIHVATALDAKLELFNTFDVQLIKKSGPIGGSNLIIERPAVAQGRLELPMFDEDEDEQES